MNKTVLSDKEIEKGRQDIFSTENPFCPCDSRTMKKVARWVEQAVLQSPEIQQLHKDAERYRWLRDSCGIVEYKKSFGGIGSGMLPSGDALDSSIDAATEVKP